MQVIPEITYLKSPSNQIIGQTRPAFINQVVRWSWYILFGASAIQLIFFFSWANLFAIAIVAMSWLVFAKVTFRLNNLNKYPLSTLMIIGYTTTQLYFPLLFTTLESRPLIHNLAVPYDVFIHSFLGLLVIITAHLIYQANARRHLAYFRKQLTRVGLFTSPDTIQMWTIGFIGIFCMIYVHLYAKSSWEVTGSASDKFLEAFVVFAYAPYYIPLSKLYGSQAQPPRRIILWLTIYTIILFLIGIGRNSRGLFMFGFVPLGLGYGLGVLLNQFRVPHITWKPVVVGLVALLVFNGPIADLSTAMVIVRGQRSEISTDQLIEETLQAFQDKQAIEQRRESDKKTATFEWDENYLDNTFLARFCNIKYNDLSLSNAYKIMDTDDGAMLNFSVNRILGILPGPVLTAFDLVQDKKKLIEFSFGDYLRAKASDGAGVLGQNVTGHFAGTGMVTFGWWYLLLLGALLIPVNLSMDAFYIQLRPVTPSARRFVWLPCFSMGGLVSLFSIFQFLVNETVINLLQFLVRGWIQMVLLYIVVFSISRGVSLVLRSIQN